jgi:hypothetical protein
VWSGTIGHRHVDGSNCNHARGARHSGAVTIESAAVEHDLFDLLIAVQVNAPLELYAHDFNAVLVCTPHLDLTRPTWHELYRFLFESSSLPAAAGSNLCSNRPLQLKRFK